MSRPLPVNISSLGAAWDSDVDGNFDKTFTQPFPIHESASLTEANVQSTFPAASFDRCLVWVNHSVIGYTLYWSNGASWIPYGSEKRTIRTSSTTTSQVITDKVVRFTGAGAVDYDFLTASAWAGVSVTVRNDAALAINLDPNSTELINGSATSLALAAGASATIYSDGTSLYTL